MYIDKVVSVDWTKKLSLVTLSENHNGTCIWRCYVAVGFGRYLDIGIQSNSD